MGCTAIGRISCWVVVLVFSLVLAGCSEGERRDQSATADMTKVQQAQGQRSLSADCEVDGAIVGIAGVLLDPGIRGGRPLPVELERVVARALPFAAPLHEFESVEVSDARIATLRSADGVRSRPGSRDAVIEVALVDDGEAEPSWLVVTWRISEPCGGD